MSCLFCDIVEKKIPSEPVFEDDRVYAFKDVHPQAPTHILIVPKKHVATVNDHADEEASLVGALFLRARDIAKTSGISEKGYRLVVNTNSWAGQSVYHLHLHLLGGRALSWPPG